MAMLCICIFTLSFSIGSYTGPSLMHIIRSLPVHSNPAVWMPRPSWAQPSVESSHLQPAIPLYSQTPGAAGAVGALPEQVATIVDTFAMVPDPKLKYQQLLFLAKALEKLPDEDHIQDNKVLGCTSQVWVTASYEDGKMHFRADSDSELTKGLAALLIKCLNGLTPQEVLLLDPSFLSGFGMQGSVTPSRVNGFLNMFKTMQRKTLDAVKNA
eukprot:CAMPEP_0174300686 /NCGR_PEP_ID=MMETSP0809-20121228/58593_1 /TAXON_ID=73025 ORGANISM="Eutreptiella gymnastica-like, Strain CCMP1594" /NCGR_SAMPLE_ID=MMETSP0809 /ASSEMBLY_ACC=CAM_ASM_000658 /LENGTH=211 /DNA_ID=CAMNT_0015406309 /DNA_START=183 /DNA_END=818 /DNA_ORIENTATION=+